MTTERVIKWWGTSMMANKPGGTSPVHQGKGNSRYVRRAFLCGEDKLTGKNYDRRKQWAIECLHDLEQVCSIDIRAYAQFANHTHLVMRVDRPSARQWDRQEVTARWRTLFSLPLLVRRYCDHPRIRVISGARALVLIPEEIICSRIVVRIVGVLYYYWSGPSRN